jgi:putative acetyltransferase
MDATLTVRTEQPADSARIRAIHESAFPGPAEGALSLVAEVDGQLVGQIAFSPVTVAGATDGLGLAPVAVVPAWQRRGVGAMLVRAGLEACAARRSGFVVVLGEPAWYRRFGFLPASQWGLSDEYGGGAAFQALEVRPGAIPRNAGLVRYAPEFAAFA